MFVFAVLVFAVLAFDETLREPVEAALFEFLSGAIFLRELFFLVFFLVAIVQVYHCGPAQFTLPLAHIDELGLPRLPVQIEPRNGNW